MNQYNSFKGEWKLGQAVMTRIRKINAIAGDPSGGSKLQLEVREIKRGKSLLSLLNEDDPRMVSPKPQPAWIMADMSSFKKHFPLPENVVNAISNLKISTGIKDLQEGVHFVNVNIVEPELGGNKMRVQIIETIVQPNEQSEPKINPSTGEIITHGGKPVYRTTQIITSEPKDVILEGDKSSVEKVLAENPAIAAAIS